MIIVIVDTETTGLDRQRDEVIELAAIRVRYPEWTTESLFYQRFRPTREVSPDAAAVNGYTPEAWAGTPRIIDGNTIDRFVEFTDGARWVGSMPQFDYDMFDRERRTYGRRPWALASRRLIDVGSLGAPLLFAGYGEKGGLDELCRVLGVDGSGLDWLRCMPLDRIGGRIGPHTAMGDALRTAGVFRRLLSAFTASPALAPLFPLFTRIAP